MYLAKYEARVPIKITDKSKPKINRVSLPLAAPATPKTLSKLKMVSAIRTLYIPEINDVFSFDLRLG